MNSFSPGAYGPLKDLDFDGVVSRYCANYYHCALFTIWPCQIEILVT